MQATPSALLPVSQGKRWAREKMKKAPNTKMSSEIGLWITDHLATWFESGKCCVYQGPCNCKEYHTEGTHHFICGCLKCWVFSSSNLVSHCNSCAFHKMLRSPGYCSLHFHNGVIGIFRLVSAVKICKAQTGHPILSRQSRKHKLTHFLGYPWKNTWHW